MQPDTQNLSQSFSWQKFPVMPQFYAEPALGNKAAFEYACAYMDDDIKKGHVMPALVVRPGPAGRDGLQSVLVRVCGRNGGFEVVAKTAGCEGPSLQAGDLVVWLPVVYLQEAGALLQDARCGWSGKILGTLKPILDMEEGWRRGEKFSDD